jgi:hypothetical protein
VLYLRIKRAGYFALCLACLPASLVSSAAKAKRVVSRVPNNPFLTKAEQKSLTRSQAYSMPKLSPQLLITFEILVVQANKQYRWLQLFMLSLIDVCLEFYQVDLSESK